MNCYQCGALATACTCVGGAYIFEGGTPTDPYAFEMSPLRAAGTNGKKQFTQEQYDAHIEKLREVMAPAQDAIRFLSAHHPTGRPSERMPMGLISKDPVRPGECVMVVASPDIAFKPTHLVVSHATSIAFNLQRVMAQNCISQANDSDLPLESFSMEYYTDLRGDELKAVMSIQKWDIPALTPAMRLVAYVKNIDTVPHVFRGILWGDAQLIW